METTFTPAIEAVNTPSHVDPNVCTHYPLVLSYKHPTKFRQWKLLIQSKPIYDIRLEGAQDPTRDEIMECLGPLCAPTWLVPVIEVLIQRAAPVHPMGEFVGFVDGQGNIVKPTADAPPNGVTVKLDPARYDSRLDLGAVNRF